MSLGARLRPFVVVALVACTPTKSKDTPSKDAPAWDGTAPFVCDGDRLVQLKGMKVSDAKALPLITASGHCQLTLTDCELEADEVVRAVDHAQVVIERGRIEAPATAPNRMGVELIGDASLTARGVSIVGKTGVSLNGNAQAVIDGGSVRGSELALGAWGTSKLEVKPGTKVDGKVYYDTHVKFTGPTELRMDASKTLVWSISPACGMVEKCYTTAGEFGRIGGRLRVQVDTAGQVASVKLDRGDAPAAAKSCFEKYQGKTLADARGRAGTLVCEYDGRFLEGGQGSMNWWPRFEPAGAAPAPSAK